MPYLVEIAASIVSILVTYIAKHSDTILDKLFSKIGNIISNKVGDTAAIVISTNPSVAVEFTVGNNEVIKKIADNHGYTEFKKNLKKGDIVKISAYGQGYCPDNAEIVIDNEQVTYCVILKLKKRRGSKKGS